VKRRSLTTVKRESQKKQTKQGNSYPRIYYREGENFRKVGGNGRIGGRELGLLSACTSAEGQLFLCWEGGVNQWGRWLCSRKVSASTSAGGEEVRAVIKGSTRGRLEGPGD